MGNQKTVEELKPFEARAIIESLRKGSVPIEYVPLFTVGREKWLKFIEDDLKNYIAEGGSKVRFINGDYGDGKTHFMSIIRYLALQQNFAISFVVLTRDIPIHKFEVVYQELVRQICGAFEGKGIRALLDTWADGLKAELLKKGNVPFAEKLTTLNERLRDLPEMDINFANALVALLEYRFGPLKEGETREERAQSCETIYQWFEGAKITKRELKPFQIFESLNKTNSKRLLTSLVVYLKHLNYKGFILLMDELETIIPQSASVRNAGYENVRLLIDNTEQAQHLHIFFSIIPDVLNSEKGFKSYDALWSRVRSVGESKKLNYRNILIDLHRTPLESKELVQLGLTLRKIHEAAYRWDSQDLISNDLIKNICQTQQKMGLMSETRLFIKQIIRSLDMAEQGDAPKSETDIKEQIIASQKEVEKEKMEQLQPKWDD